MSSHIQYKVGKAGRMYVVRRVEDQVGARGKHSGSIRTVSRHDNAADAEVAAQELRSERAGADGAAWRSRVDG